MMAMSHSSVPSASLITEEYRELQRKLHENPHYGAASLAYAPIVAEVIKRLHAPELLEAIEILDYGAGKGHLGEA